MKEIPAAVVLQSLPGQLRVESDGCWRWLGKDDVVLGFEIGTLLYGWTRGVVGRGVALTKCAKHPWCVNPWHYFGAALPMHRYKTHCRWGHELLASGRCRECDRIKKAKWRAKQPAKLVFD